MKLGVVLAVLICMLFIWEGVSIFSSHPTDTEIGPHQNTVMAASKSSSRKPTINTTISPPVKNAVKITETSSPLGSAANLFLSLAERLAKTSDDAQSVIGLLSEAATLPEGLIPDENASPELCRIRSYVEGAVPQGWDVSNFTLNVDAYDYHRLIMALIPHLNNDGRKKKCLDALNYLTFGIFIEKQSDWWLNNYMQSEWVERITRQHEFIQNWLTGVESGR
jgi:hypothetical protein